MTNKEILEKIRQTISSSTLKQSAVDDFMEIIEAAKLRQQKTLLNIFKEDPTLASVMYLNLKKKQAALESDYSRTEREILAAEFDLLSSL